MNTKKNQHYMSTHRNIQKAVTTLLETKDLSHISVREICEVAEINHSTFYAHYSSIYDLLDEIDSLLKVDHLTLFSAANVKWESFLDRNGLEIILKYMYDHKAFYNAYVSQLSKITYIENSFNELWEAQNQDPFWDKNSGKKQMFFAFTFFMGGALKLIECWLKHDCQESIENLTCVISQMVPPELKAYNSAPDCSSNQHSST